MVMANHGLSCKINEPTRIKNDSQSLIDHVFVRCNVNLKCDVKAWIINSQITDHFMTAISIELSQATVKPINKSINLTPDFKILNKAIIDADWRLVYTSCSVSVAFSHF